MQAIVFDKLGLPTDVLELRDIKRPAPASGQVLVKMLNAPINQGDFLFIQNLYPEPKKPYLPGQVAGNYGTGVVIERGPGASLTEGTLVAIIYYNTWAEYAAIPEEWLIPLPSGFPPEKAAQMMPLITAWDVVEGSKAKSREWVAVTAANSANALMIMQLAVRKGLRVIALVRKLPPPEPPRIWGRGSDRSFSRRGHCPRTHPGDHGRQGAPRCHRCRWRSSPG